jgi:LDH2 family malate/lactate/ureidoglycolate dehydrogenase
VVAGAWSFAAEWPRVPLNRLQALISHALEREGVAPDRARLVAEMMARADARGLGAHGVWRVAYVIDRLRAGTIDPHAQVRVELDLGALALLSAERTLGAWATHEALAAARDRAERYGLGGVAVKDSNHFGIASAFTEPLARAGFTALLWTNASPAIAPHHAREARLGNNTFSLAAPRAGGAPVVVDLSTSVVSRGEILLARDSGSPIPETWALDAAGNPTSDPNAALAGVLRPIGDHKGAALSIAADMLTGVLTGTGVLDDVAFPGAASRVGNVSHFALVIDSQRLSPTSREGVDAYLQRLTATPAITGHTVSYPGELEAAREEEAARHGVPLRPEAFAVVRTMAENYGVELT